MYKRVWINILLFIVIIILLIIILSEKNKIGEKASSLSIIDPNSISTIQIQRKNLSSILFNKIDDKWKINSPVQIQANPIRIKSILNILTAESHKKLNLNEIDITQFDLRSPKVILKLDQNNFHFGTTNPIDQRRYVLFDETIHLIDDYLFSQLMVNVYFFADNKLLADNEDIKSIDFPDYKIYKNNGQWVSTKKDYDEEKIKNIVMTWENLIAAKVEEYQLNDGSYKKDCAYRKSCNPAISIETSSGEKISFSIEKEKPNLILGREPIYVQYIIMPDDVIQMF